MSHHVHHYRLLLVEDNPADMRLMAEGMRHAGLTDIATTTQCYNAEECLRHLEHTLATRRPFHLVMLDLNMPRTSGKELISQIRADRRCARVPIFVFTNSDSPRDLQECMDLGADMYIQKPSDFTRQIELFEAIGRSLREHHRVLPSAIPGHHLPPARSASR